ncbi:MAG: tRNA epoxyqueuosine(34) reductase QueG [Sediminibacterium sp.]|jgi:epoxyqueuosine reductase|nr:tRNA epoxyqueuosine(34) reductase QueG [Sediminibacterium sp.]
MYSNTQLIKQLAMAMGFDYCGIAQAKELTEDAIRLEQWLHKGYHGEMEYMAKNFDLRIDPRKLVPGAKSVICFIKNYYPSEEQEKGIPQIAKYAWGNDYHEVIRNQLHEFLDQLRKQIGPIEGRGFVDSAPVLERSWAQLAGAGWIGKNGNLIKPQTGSFFFIATLIVDIELMYDQPISKDFCGTCTKCIDACPTQAILPNKTIEANHCISYLTIELKKETIHTNRNYKEWAFGCDICQDVCPWNRFSHPHKEPAFKPLDGLLQMRKEDWLEMEETTFKARFKHSPLLRSKLKGIKRNITYLE